MSTKFNRTYIAIYSRHYRLDYDEFDTLQEAIDFLEVGDEYETMFSLAVVETETKKIVWYHDMFLISKADIEEAVAQFFEQYSENRKDD
jgi:hypothetical protein